MPTFDHYSKIIPTTRGLAYAKREFERDLNLIETLLDTNLRVFPILEIGPGLGIFAKECIRRGHEYLAVEPNEKLASKLENDGINVIRQSAPPISVTSCSCGVVYASHLVEHMADVNCVINLLHEMLRVTKSGGLIYIKVPDYLSWGKEFWNGDYTHNFVTTERRLQQIYTDTGLDIVKVIYCSGQFTGFTARIVSLAARIFPHRFLGLIMSPFFSVERFYNAKVTFLGNLVVIGRKP